MIETTTSNLTPLLLTNEEAAKLLNMSPRTLANWRLKGLGPRYTHITDNPKSPVRYRHRDILDWIDSRFEGR